MQLMPSKQQAALRRARQRAEQRAGAVQQAQPVPQSKPKAQQAQPAKPKWAVLLPSPMPPAAAPALPQSEVDSSPSANTDQFLYDYMHRVQNIITTAHSSGIQGVLVQKLKDRGLPDLAAFLLKNKPEDVGSVLMRLPAFKREIVAQMVKEWEQVSCALLLCAVCSVLCAEGVCAAASHAQPTSLSSPPTPPHHRRSSWACWEFGVGVERCCFGCGALCGGTL